MGYSVGRASYEITVEGGFVGPGQWVVHGVVHHKPGPSVASRADAESEARLDLMVGIARESRRGNDAGARNVHVVIDGDREIAGLFRLNLVVPPQSATFGSSSTHAVRFRSSRV